MTPGKEGLTFVRNGAELTRELRGWPRWRAVLRAAAIAGFYPLSRLTHLLGPRRRSLRVVLYHHVFDDQRDGFRRHLEYLSRHFEFVDIERFLGLLSGGGKPEGQSKLLVTFDDGFKDNLTNAAPILESFGVRAAFFVSTGFVSLSKDDVEGYRRYTHEVLHSARPVEGLDWEDVVELAKRGHAVGSHTVRHARLSELSRDETLRELTGSRRVLEEKLGRAVRDLSFPYGRESDYRADLTELACEAGYRSCFNMIRGVNFPGGDPFFVYRDALDAGWPLVQVKYFMERE